MRWRPTTIQTKDGPRSAMWAPVVECRACGSAVEGVQSDCEKPVRSWSAKRQVEQPLQEQGAA